MKRVPAYCAATSPESRAGTRFRRSKLWRGSRRPWRYLFISCSYEGDEPPPLPNLLRFLEKLRRLISELARERQGHEARQRYFHDVVLEIRDGANECAMALRPSPYEEKLTEICLDLIVYLSSKHAVGTTRVLASLMKATLLLRVLRDVRDFSVKQRVVLTAIIHHFVEIVRNILCPTTRPL